MSTPGLGKSALARSVAEQAALRLGWTVVAHRCRRKERALWALAVATADALRRAWPDAAGAPPRGSLDAGSRRWPRLHPAHPAGTGLLTQEALRGALRAGEATSWASLRDFFLLLGQWARSAGQGVVLVVDDADRLPPGDAEGVGHLARCLSAQQAPVALLMTGGPSLDQRFARAGYFSGAVWPSELGCFDDAESREALVVPALDRGTQFEDSALGLLVGPGQGLPLQVQRLGLAAWSAARGRGLITRADAELALAQVAPAAIAGAGAVDAVAC
jgi:hypothetical protein